MADFDEVAVETLTVRAQATVNRADTGSGTSYVEFYDSADTKLVTIQLSKPCGTVSAGVITLVPADLAGGLIEADGTAVRARWFTAAGSLVAGGQVSDETGVGPFFIAGAEGTQLYAGGRAVLGVTEIT